MGDIRQKLRRLTAEAPRPHSPATIGWPMPTCAEAQPSIISGRRKHGETEKKCRLSQLFIGGDDLAFARAYGRCQMLRVVGTEVNGRCLREAFLNHILVFTANSEVDLNEGDRARCIIGLKRALNFGLLQQPAFLPPPCGEPWPRTPARRDQQSCKQDGYQDDRQKSPSHSPACRALPDRMCPSSSSIALGSEIVENGLG